MFVFRKNELTGHLSITTYEDKMEIFIGIDVAKAEFEIKDSASPNAYSERHNQTGIRKIVRRMAASRSHRSTCCTTIETGCVALCTVLPVFAS